MVGANCETEPLRFLQTSVLYITWMNSSFNYHFLIWTYTWNDFQFLEL